MRTPPPQLADFKKDATRPFDYLSRAEIDEIVSVVRDLADQQSAISEQSSDDA